MEHLGRRVVERIHELSSIKRLSLSLSLSPLSYVTGSFEICKYTPFDAHNSRYTISRRGGGGWLRRIERCNSRRVAHRPEIHISVPLCSNSRDFKRTRDTWTEFPWKTCKVVWLIDRRFEFWPRFSANRAHHYRTDSLYRE